MLYMVSKEKEKLVKILLLHYVEIQISAMLYSPCIIRVLGILK